MGVYIIDLDTRFTMGLWICGIAFIVLIIMILKRKFF